jgi:hypothetical protein
MRLSTPTLQRMQAITQGGFRLFPFRSPLLRKSLSLPGGTKMFQFPPCPPTGLCVQPVVTEYCSAGFPHSGVSGSTLDDNSPKLIAAIRALHRPLAPRHPPHALSSLIHVRRQHLMSIRLRRLCCRQRMLSIRSLRSRQSRRRVVRLTSIPLSC